MSSLNLLIYQYNDIITKRIMNGIAKAFLKIYSSFIKKTNNYVIFESSNDFFDNGYALYQYVKEHYPQYKIKYIVTSKKMMQSGQYRGISKKEMLKSSNKLTLYKYSLKAKAIFINYLNYWKKFKLPETTKLVFLTHGEFPLKDCSEYYDYMFGDQENKITILTRTEFTKKTLLDVYPPMRNHSMEILGMPRNDIMFHSNINKESVLKSFGLKEYKNQDVILSMTTFRNKNVDKDNYFEKEFPINLTNNDLEKLNELLKQNNQVLLIKLHPKQENVIKPTNLDNILFITNKNIIQNNTTTGELYTICSALLTDYSTSYLGFLNLDRRIGFILSDKDKYSKDRGWTIPNVEEYMPGEKLYTKEDLFAFFQHSDSEQYKKDRQRIRELLTGNYKDQNCKLIAEKFL